MKLFAVLVLIAAVATTAIANKPVSIVLGTVNNDPNIDDIIVWANFTDPLNINKDSSTVASASSAAQDPSTVSSATSVNQDASTAASASSAAQGSSTVASASSTNPPAPVLNTNTFRLQYADAYKLNGPLDLVCRAVESNSFGNSTFQELQSVRWRTGDSCNNQRDVQLTLQVEVIAETTAPTSTTNTTPASTTTTTTTNTPTTIGTTITTTTTPASTTTTTTTTDVPVPLIANYLNKYAESVVKVNSANTIGYLMGDYDGEYGLSRFS